MRALVTGGGQRVGRAIAVELGRQGFDVAIHHRSSLRGAEDTLTAVKAAGGSGWLVRGDLTRPADVADMVAQVSSRWDTLDVLVHNASHFERKPFEEVSLEHLDAMWGVHVRGPFLLTQGLLPLLRAGGSAAGRSPGEGGLVVSIGDIGAERSLADHAAYTLSKAALLALSRSLAVELAPTVRSVVVSPGQVAWPPDYDDDTRARLARRIPMGRVGTPEDVARLVRFVALEAPYLNGVVLNVDGGLAARY